MEYTKGATSVDYGYDSEGQRVSKTVNGVKYDYYYVGGKLMVEHCPSYTLFYSYDANGNLYAIKKQFSNSSYEYYYAVCNSRGDVLALYNEGGNLECKYHYDSWGKLISVVDHNGNSITAKNHIAIQNSIRYRGYVYDTETGLYYLNSRYYDPETCRFINADSYISTGQRINGYNMYEYCGSNPLIRCDPSGQSFYDFVNTLTHGIDWLSNVGKSLVNYDRTIYSEINVSQSVFGFQPPLIDITQTTTFGSILYEPQSQNWFSVYQILNLNPSIGAKITTQKISVDFCFGKSDSKIAFETAHGNTAYSLAVKADLSTCRIGIEYTHTTTEENSYSGLSYFLNINMTDVLIFSSFLFGYLGNVPYFSTSDSVPAPVYS